MAMDGMTLFEALNMSDLFHQPSLFSQQKIVLSDFSVRALQLLTVLLLDKFITLPSSYHPALLFKYLAGQLTHKVNRRSVSHQKMAGTILLILLVALVLGVTWALMSFAVASWFYEIILLWLMISSRPLFNKTSAIERSLARGHKLLAREQLQNICLRDTSSLSNVGIVKATIEALPQRLAIAYFNPIVIYACVGIYPTIAAVTVTALAQHWNPKLSNFRHFGRAASYLSQLICLPCHSLMSLNIVLLFGTVNALNQSVKLAKQWHRFGNGLLLSTTALVLNCQLGGAVIYQNIKIRRPTLGCSEQPNINNIANIIRICQQLANSWLLILIAVLLTSLALDGLT